MLDRTSRDFRYALRKLQRTPGFTLIAVLLVALSVGVSTAVFSIVNAVFLSDLPYENPGELFAIERVDARPTCKASCEGGTTLSELHEWRSRLGTAVDMAGLRVYQTSVATPTATELVEGSLVTTNFFQLLGLRPLLGRSFTAADGRPGAADVVILEHSIWQSRFGGDTAILSRSIMLDGRMFRVIGVMPARGDIGRPIFNATARASQFFVPIGPYAARTDGGARFYTILARIGPRVSPERVRGQLDALFAGALAAHGDHAPSADGQPVWRSRITGLRRFHAQALASSNLILLGAVLFTVLVACANLAGLFLARLSGRRREIALRRALGASRAALLRQHAAEGILVAGIGGVGGIVMAYWGSALARVLLPARDIPYWTTFAIDFRVLAFAAALATVSCVLFSVVPASMLTRDGATSGVRAAGGHFSGGRDVTTTRQLLVGVEVACTLVLLTGAGLLVKTFVEAATRDMGMARRGVIRGFLYGRGAGIDSPAQQRAMARAVLERLQRIPGVSAASLSGTPLDEPEYDGLLVEGSADVIPAGIVPSSVEGVTPDEFLVQGIPVLHGRAFTAADGIGDTPVAILSEPTARRLFPKGNAIGRRVRFVPSSDATQWMTIVGIVGATRQSALTATEPYHPAMYRPLAQAPTSMLAFALRTRGAPTALLPAVRHATHEVLPNVPLAALTSIEDRLDSQLAPLRANSIMLGGLAIFVLILAGLGLYGLVAQLIAERTHEIGVRMALGATGPAVLLLVTRSALTMTLWGVAMGLLASHWLTRILRSFLYGSSTSDPRVFIAAALVLVATAIVAAYLPARRATRVDPMLALRTP